MKNQKPSVATLFDFWQYATYILKCMVVKCLFSVFNIGFDKLMNNRGLVLLIRNLSAMTSQITGNSIVCSIACSAINKVNIRAPHYETFVRKITAEFHSQWVSNAENISEFHRITMWGDARAVMHVGSLTRGGGKNVPGACSTRNFTYLAIEAH